MGYSSRNGYPFMGGKGLTFILEFDRQLAFQAIKKLFGFLVKMFNRVLKKYFSAPC